MTRVMPLSSWLRESSLPVPARAPPRRPNRPRNTLYSPEIFRIMYGYYSPPRGATPALTRGLSGFNPDALRPFLRPGQQSESPLVALPALPVLKASPARRPHLAEEISITVIPATAIHSKSNPRSADRTPTGNCFRFLYHRTSVPRTIAVTILYSSSRIRNDS